MNWHISNENPVCYDRRCNDLTGPYQLANVFVHLSFYEGLPILCSDIRCARSDAAGASFAQQDADDTLAAIIRPMLSGALYYTKGNLTNLQEFEVHNMISRMREICQQAI